MIGRRWPYTLRSALPMPGAAFKGKGDEMVAAMAKLDAAAKTGNADSLKAAFGEAAKTCKACHDAYRKE